MTTSKQLEASLALAKRRDHLLEYFNWLQRPDANPYVAMGIGAHSGLDKLVSQQVLRSAVAFTIGQEIAAIDKELQCAGVTPEPEFRWNDPSGFTLMQMALDRNMWRDAWVRELGPIPQRSFHLIDNVVIATRIMRGDAERARG